uniref:Uncharacterized protein n=1 Tax=Triticum urartu TaxID=4572 RepID=A0A8R7TUP3_TRIUA
MSLLSRGVKEGYEGEREERGDGSPAADGTGLTAARSAPGLRAARRLGLGRDAREAAVHLFLVVQRTPASAGGRQTAASAGGRRHLQLVLYPWIPAQLETFRYEHTYNMSCHERCLPISSDEDGVPLFFDTSTGRCWIWAL